MFCTLHHSKGFFPTTHLLYYIYQDIIRDDLITFIVKQQYLITLALQATVDVTMSMEYGNILINFPKPPVLSALNMFAFYSLRDVWLLQSKTSGIENIKFCSYYSKPTLSSNLSDLISVLLASDLVLDTVGVPGVVHGTNFTGWPGRTVMGSCNRNKSHFIT